MAVWTKCPKCEGTNYEVHEIEPYGGKFKQIAIQCRSCATPIGVVMTSAGATSAVHIFQQ